jgi:hypothetical protein
MKRVGIMVGLVVLVIGLSLWAQMTAPKPDPEIKKFDVFLGHWTYTGEYKAGPLGPAIKVTGEWSCRGILGGFFFQNQFAEKGPMGESRGIEIVGYDPAKKAFFTTEYHDDGNMLSGVYVSEGNAFTYTGKFNVGGKTYMLKAAITPAADSMSFTVKAGTSPDGNSWTPWVEAKYTKVPQPSPKK